MLIFQVLSPDPFKHSETNRTRKQPAKFSFNIILLNLHVIIIAIFLLIYFLLLVLCFRIFNIYFSIIDSKISNNKEYIINRFMYIILKKSIIRQISIVKIVMVAPHRACRPLRGDKKKYRSIPDLYFQNRN